VEIIAPERLAVEPGPAGASAVRLAVAPNPRRAAGGGDRTVSLSFELPEAGEIELAIYDMSGRRVATPARRTFGAGAHRSTWDGRDESGTAVPPGVYFARLNHANGATTSRIVAVH
jgi:flagellar hook assembly protein FlgD